MSDIQAAASAGEVIAEAAEKHGDWYGWSAEFQTHARFCTCGMWMDSSPSVNCSRASHAAHVSVAVSAALREAGYTIMRPVTEAEEAADSWDAEGDLTPGAFGPVNRCCGVTASVGHGLYCENRPLTPIEAVLNEERQ